MYYYRCGDPSIGMSDIYSFKSMPVSNRWSYPNRIAIVGDLGLTYNTTATLSHMMSHKPDLLLIIGDMSYANMYLTNGTGTDCYSCTFSDTPIHETYQPRWDFWGRYAFCFTQKIDAGDIVCIPNNLLINIVHNPIYLYWRANHIFVFWL